MSSSHYMLVSFVEGAQEWATLVGDLAPPEYSWQTLGRVRVTTRRDQNLWIWACKFAPEGLRPRKEGDALFSPLWVQTIVTMATGRRVHAGPVEMLSSIEGSFTLEIMPR